VELLWFSFSSGDRCISSLHCCIAIVIHLTESWQTVGLPFFSYGELFSVVHGKFYERSHIRNLKGVWWIRKLTVYCRGRSIILFPWVSDVLRLRSKDFDVLVQWKVTRSDHSWYAGTQLVEPWYLRRVFTCKCGTVLPVCNTVCYNHLGMLKK